MGQTIRIPAVAGQFYNADTQDLKNQIEEYIDNTAEKKDCIGAVSPHAGYMYSGSVAGSLYSNIRIPGTVVLLGPNHTGIGERISLMQTGEWSMPFGSMSVSEDFSSILLRKTGIISVDNRAHLLEHSLEVQLPFIHYFNKDAHIVPVLLMSVGIDDCRELGHALAEAIKDHTGKTLIIASSDMSHYVSDELARKKDKLAIDRVIDIDPDGLYDVIKKQNISMCGFLPATVMLFAARELGANEGELIKYSTSGEMSGDYEHVVGYAGITVK
jgi:hypothetical protein